MTNFKKNKIPYKNCKQIIPLQFIGVKLDPFKSEPLKKHWKITFSSNKSISVCMTSIKRTSKIKNNEIPYKAKE